MALSQSLSTGITGLMTHQTAMDNLGNNLANVNTTGFKRGVYQFSNLLHQSIRGGMAADSTSGRGSVNPISMGMGAQTASINKVFTQGNLENTGNPTDLAINGNGFFVLRQGTGYAYTRAGSFHLGEDRYLTSPEGLYVQGTMAVRQADGSYVIPSDAKMQDIVIPIGTVGGHSQTTKVEYSGNLDSTKEVSKGLNLFGTSTFPTIDNLQSWMAKGDSSDSSWNVLEDNNKRSFGISKATVMHQAGINPNQIDAEQQLQRYLQEHPLPSNVTMYSNGEVYDLIDSSTTTPNLRSTYSTVLNYTETDADGNEVSKSMVYDFLADDIAELNKDRTPADPDNPYDPEDPNRLFSHPVRVRDIDDVITALQDMQTTDPTRLVNPIPETITAVLPLVQEMNTINGGNVQTSAEYGIKVPAFESGHTNRYTYPKWFYEATGAEMPYSQISKLPNSYFEVDKNAADQDAEKQRVADNLKAIWPNGMAGIDGNKIPINTADFPGKDSVYPASLNTPLEGLCYLKGNSWVQPFANIKQGDEVTIDFKKGESQLSATFVYNRPADVAKVAGQTSINQEKSYTLEHFLKFMAGDVDNPMTACLDISPELFGYQEGMSESDWDSAGYQQALANSSLATSSSNQNTTNTGVMGLLSIPPHISDKNGGSDAYDVPGESAGAYTRTGTTTYPRNDSLGSTTNTPGDSFYVSLVSNLGEQNALSDIRITYNDVPHESMFSNETEYAAKQGGSSMVTVDFYDSLGNPKSATIRMSMVSQDNDFTTWRWYGDCTSDSDFEWLADDNGDIMSSLSIGTGLIRFDKEGNFVKGAEYSETNGITIDQRNQGVNNPIWIKVLNGLSSSSQQDLDFSRMTCTAAKPDFKLYTQNGRAPGTLKEFVVGQSGIIQGLYDNGNVVDLARVGLAQIPNETGLICAGGNLFYTGPASGDALYGHAGTGGLGDIHQSQLETSNVDLSVEFTRLITIERGFQANSRTITTADEMIQELLNLKR